MLNVAINYVKSGYLNLPSVDEILKSERGKVIELEMSKITIQPTK